jgi:hypothetical protein
MGVPGSGKTTLCNAVHEELRKTQEADLFFDLYKKALKKKLKKQRKIEYLRFLSIKPLKGDYIPSYLFSEEISKYIIHNSRVYSNVLQSILNNPHPKRRENILKYFLTDVYRWRLIRKNSPSDQLVIMDEGFAHRALNIYMYVERNNISVDLKRFFSTIELPEAVVNIKSGTEETIERMNNRSHGLPTSFRLYTDDELRNNINLMDEFTSELLSFFKEEGVKVIELENKDLKSAKKNIIHQLNIS